MSERDSYQPGVPCWVDNLVPDLDAALRFYAELFGWEFDGPGPGDYYVAKLRGRDVAGVGAQPPGVPAAWNTYVSVASVEDVVRAAAGHVTVEPFDALPAGRVAVLEDPSGAAIGLWEPAERHGAQLVNEPGAWSMSMLYAQDPGNFYRELFGWEAEPFGAPGVSLFRLPGFVGGEPGQPVPRDVVAVIAPPEPGSAPAWGVGFWVTDADDVAARAPQLGGRVLAEPFDGFGMRQAVLADPAGAAFSVTTAPHPG
jgi:predicted enzyme related to lactoylglutathione lyase